MLRPLPFPFVLKRTGGGGDAVASGGRVISWEGPALPREVPPQNLCQIFLPSVFPKLNKNTSKLRSILEHERDPRNPPELSGHPPRGGGG